MERPVDRRRRSRARSPRSRAFDSSSSSSYSSSFVCCLEEKAGSAGDEREGSRVIRAGGGGGQRGAKRRARAGQRDKAPANARTRPPPTTTTRPTHSSAAAVKSLWGLCLLSLSLSLVAERKGGTRSFVWVFLGIEKREGSRTAHGRKRFGLGWSAAGRRARAPLSQRSLLFLRLFLGVVGLLLGAGVLVLLVLADEVVLLCVLSGVVFGGSGGR